jgi:cysteinyl-tRNA synthetase
VSVKSLGLLVCMILAGCGGGTEPTGSEPDYREAMRTLVEGISGYANGFSPGFIVIPQNGHELLTQDGEAGGPLAHSYVSAIEGVGREDLFYGYNSDNVPTPAAERDYMLGFMDRAELAGVEVLVTDYVWDQASVDDSYQQSVTRNYISFAADHRELDNIPASPSQPFNVHSLNISSLSDASNFLYLLEPSTFGDKATYLGALAATDYDLVIVDLFFGQEQLTAGEITSIGTKAGGGQRLVIAYMSIGEAEDYRYYWQTAWTANPPSWIEAENPDWPGNYKVRYWEPQWQALIYGNDGSYMKRILDAGFDGVYLDIIDAFEFFEGR